MPEGDSVYRLAQRLRFVLDGRILAVGRLNVAAHSTSDLAGRQVLGHATHGKHLLTRFDQGLTLHTHLRMDGRWTVVRPGRRLPITQRPDIRVHLGLADGTGVFGLRLPVVTLLPTAEEWRAVGHLGPDLLAVNVDLEEALRRFGAEPDLPIKAALLDQRLAAGLGNLWANELCFLRGVNPWTPTSQVDMSAMLRLAVRALRISAEVPGLHQVTTGNTHRGETHWVSGRAHRPCLRCGTMIKVHAGSAAERRTWWCPHCQPART